MERKRIEFQLQNDKTWDDSKADYFALFNTKAFANKTKNKNCDDDSRISSSDLDSGSDPNTMLANAMGEKISQREGTTNVKEYTWILTITKRNLLTLTTVNENTLSMEPFLELWVVRVASISILQLAISLVEIVMFLFQSIFFVVIWKLI